MWIEISHDTACTSHGRGHPPHGGCGLKYPYHYHHGASPASSSAWRMWIEMFVSADSAVSCTCHPPHGGCGLKFSSGTIGTMSIPRHPPHGGCGLKSLNLCGKQHTQPSSSAWRMWIEIYQSTKFQKRLKVILRMEDVD